MRAGKTLGLTLIADGGELIMMMSADDAYRLELQVAMEQCYLDGDIPGAEIYQQMIDELDEYQED